MTHVSIPELPCYLQSMYQHHNFCAISGTRSYQYNEADTTNLTLTSKKKKNTPLYIQIHWTLLLTMKPMIWLTSTSSDANLESVLPAFWKYLQPRTASCHQNPTAPPCLLEVSSIEDGFMTPPAYSKYLQSRTDSCNQNPILSLPC